MNTPQRQHIGLPALVAMVAMVAVFLIPAWIPALRTAPWEWIVVAIQAILTVAWWSILSDSCGSNGTTTGANRQRP